MQKSGGFAQADLLNDAGVRFVKAQHSMGRRTGGGRWERGSSQLKNSYPSPSHTPSPLSLRNLLQTHPAVFNSLFKTSQSYGTTQASSGRHVLLPAARPSLTPRLSCPATQARVPEARRQRRPGEARRACRGRDIQSEYDAFWYCID